jgi:hypothetical protein
MGGEETKADGDLFKAPSHTYLYCCHDGFPENETIVLHLQILLKQLSCERLRCHPF